MGIQKEVHEESGKEASGTVQGVERQESYEYVHWLMQSSLSRYHQDYDKVSRDHEAVEQEAEHKGQVSVVPNVHEHREAEVERR